MHCQAWSRERLNLDLLIAEMRAQPLIHVQQFLLAPPYHHQFRDLSAPLWLASRPLAGNKAKARLGVQIADLLARFYCPVEGCKKNYKQRGRLNNHVITHAEFERLSAVQKDDVLHEINFDLPPQCGLRRTVAPTDYAAPNATPGTVSGKRGHIDH
jgi:hypothetical protein